MMKLLFRSVLVLLTVFSLRTNGTLFSKNVNDLTIQSPPSYISSTVPVDKAPIIKFFDQLLKKSSIPPSDDDEDDVIVESVPFNQFKSKHTMPQIPKFNWMPNFFPIMNSLDASDHHLKLQPKHFMHKKLPLVSVFLNDENSLPDMTTFEPKTEPELEPEFDHESELQSIKITENQSEIYQFSTEKPLDPVTTQQYEDNRESDDKLNFNFELNSEINLKPEIEFTSDIVPDFKTKREFNVKSDPGIVQNILNTDIELTTEIPAEPKTDFEESANHHFPTTEEEDEEKEVTTPLDIEDVRTTEPHTTDSAVEEQFNQADEILERVSKELEKDLMTAGNNQDPSIVRTLLKKKSVINKLEGFGYNNEDYIFDDTNQSSQQLMPFSEEESHDIAADSYETDRTVQNFDKDENTAREESSIETSEKPFITTDNGQSLSKFDSMSEDFNFSTNTKGVKRHISHMKPLAPAPMGMLLKPKVRLHDLFDKDITSVEKAEKINILLQRTMGLVKIVGHLDTFFARRMKRTIRHLAHLYNI